MSSSSWMMALLSTSDPYILTEVIPVWIRTCFTSQSFICSSSPFAIMIASCRFSRRMMLPSVPLPSVSKALKRGPQLLQEFESWIFIHTVTMMLVSFSAMQYYFLLTIRPPHLTARITSPFILLQIGQSVLVPDHIFRQFGHLLVVTVRLQFLPSLSGWSSYIASQSLLLHVIIFSSFLCPQVVKVLQTIRSLHKVAFTLL